MPEKPILFSGEMVRAILAGGKSQTRRVGQMKRGVTLADLEWDGPPGAIRTGRAKFEHIKVPYSVGDRLWVRETLKRDPDLWKYAADGTPVGWPARQALASKRLDYAPSIHMPRAASRITLIVTDVRVQRLQDISEADAIAEGVEPMGDPGWPGFRDYGNPKVMNPSARGSFRTLWDSLNADRGYDWDTNPWVVAVTFERESSDA